MKIIYGNNERQDEAKRITISNVENIEFDIYFNNFGELVVRKSIFGDGEGAMIIRPSVSNEIRIS